LRARRPSGKKGKKYPHLCRARVGKCIICGKEYYAVNDYGNYKQKYCSRKCWSNRRVTYYRICPHCSIEFKTSEKRKRYCSKACSLSVHLGDKSHLWKGGLTKRSKIEKTCAKYRHWRMSVFKRDNFTCVICGVHNRTLEADHIKPQSVHPELRYDLKNGRTLCHECHKKTDTYGYKQRWGAHFTGNKNVSKFD